MKNRFKLIGITLIVILIIIGIYNSQFKVKFDSNILDMDQIISHSEELSSSKYEGRLAGSYGDELSLNYIANEFADYGIEAGGENNTYLQSFNTIITQIDQDPIFTINNSDGTTKQSLNIYEDYNILTSYNGGSVDFDGEIILVGSNILRIPKEMIKDRIVVIISATLNPERVQYVADNGGKGILCSADSENFSGIREYEQVKHIGLEGKQGNEILMGYISRTIYKDFLDSVEEDSKDIKYIEGIISTARIKVDVKYPVVETSNILGLIEGRSSNNRTLMITTNIDGLGFGSDENYFPGAMKSTTGIASLIELGRVLKAQDNLPYENIVLVGWNGQEQQLSGSSYYLKNPIYPLDATTIIHIENLGLKTLEGLKVSADRMNSTILRDKFLTYGWDQGLSLSVERQGYTAVNGFIDQLVPALVLNNGYKRSGTYDDTMEYVDLETLEGGVTAILAFIQREYYKDYRVNYLNIIEIMILTILGLMITVNIMISYLYRRHSNQTILGYKVETIYYNYAIMLNRKFIKHVLPYFIIVFLIVMLANLSPGTDIAFVNNQWVTNFSPYILFKKTIMYIRSLLDLASHMEYQVGNIFDVIYDSSTKSIRLISVTLAFATIIGIIKGVFDGIRSHKAKISSIGTLIIFSVPDVLIVLLGLLVYVFIAKNFPLFKDSLPINEFILPVITLMILPTIYISRITFITTQNELDKDYIRNAKAIGMSKFRVFATELFPSIAFTIVDTMPTIMAMILSNMIIVEYMFNYNGIIYYLLYLYNKQDTYRFVPLALTLGAIYIVFTYGSYWVAKMINPLKREVKS